MSNKDYTRKAIYIFLSIILVLVGVMFIPSYTLGGITIKRANIASGFIHFNDEIDEKYKLKPEVTDQIFSTEIPEDLKEIIDEKQSNVTIKKHPLVKVDTSYLHIEDYSTDSMMYNFYRSLDSGTTDSIVRIGVCGDSYIESDIITSDLREQLQQDYGGKGIGFVPFSHPLLKYRNTITTTSYGWKNYSIMKKKEIPDSLKNHMYISGNISVPELDNAKCFYKGKDVKKFISSCNIANIYFNSSCDNKISVTINDSIEKEFDIHPNKEIQCLSITDNDIRTLSFTIAKKDGFIGYGVCFDGDNGIIVDNYSIRGNSGLNLFRTPMDINTKMNSYLKYDMIILQYGLNVLSEDVKDYSKYKDGLKELITYFKICMPHCAIVVMGVSDRAKKNPDGTLRSMNSISNLIDAQRQAAIETGVAFWNTFKAMGGSGAIIQFVKKGWAGSDYTHINYKGGKYIADQLVACISKEVESTKAQEILKNINPVHNNLPNQVESDNEKIFRIVCSLDKSKHRFVSRIYDRRLRKW